MNRFTALVFFLVIASTALAQRYQLPITVTDGQHTKVLRVGMWPGATDGYDAGIDTLAPPAPPSGAFDARLRVTSPANDFFTDMRANTITPRTHRMLYAAATGAGPIILTWNQASLDSLDPLGTFIITDDITGGLYTLDMKTTGTLNTSSSPFLPSSLRIVITPATPVPIQLASFTGGLTSGGLVLLEWMTLSEINNYGFEIQRHSEGEPFASLPGVFIPGHGTTNVPQHYSFVDSTAGSGVWYYRLKQIDLDGTPHYSDDIRVSTLTDVPEQVIPTVFSLSQNYPNPFNPSTTIRYGLPYASYVTITVYSALGRQVAQLVNRQQQAGYHETEFRGDDMASGVYYCRIQAGEFLKTIKLLLLR